MHLDASLMIPWLYLFASSKSEDLQRYIRGGKEDPKRRNLKTITGGGGARFSEHRHKNGSAFEEKWPNITSIAEARHGFW
jgi:hypothetical protein